ncbi:MAG: thioredoxin [Betaproteobacteria bacterium RIFCSPLOWO2_02_FULL_67_26]|nr:MAG: thioredoxin [Betaproteobacteria bacterium RIFCSPLOWO2_02_FULL_67_26]
MPNRLATQTSPYLRQHAANPVDWQPWDDEALALARENDRPILLSIGYSACHWCHVMAHESFEDAEVAAEMNRHFVNIKVDREERPDLDQIYQTAHAMLTQRSGGWPLTMFLMPDGTPFFGGTYFPKHGRHGMTGFLDILPRIAQAYRDKREEIGKQNAALLEALARTLPAAEGARELKRAPLDAAVREFAQVFDDVHGGIGHAPKFPHPFELAYCLRRHVLDGGELGLAIARLTLARMAEGGIYDQLGGGFCRYSVDPHWAIPHFEKMLYDNAALIALYSDAWLVTRQPLFEAAVRETAQWVMREMQSQGNANEGGYYSSLDADSEHEEGKYYVWTPQEVKSLVTEAEYAVVGPHYGLDGAPNFEGRYWHLHVAQPLDAVAGRLGVPLAECASRLARARVKLFAARERRIRPGRDEKTLTSWNAMMVRGMARAARVFGEPGWLASARRALAFLRATMWRREEGADKPLGRLTATYKDGVAHLNAYLDDHAFLLDALLELMQGEFRADDLAFARELAEILLAKFEDRAAGGFYFVSHDHEQLIHRAKPGHDNATPSGNGIAAFALQRLGHLIGETRYLEAAERALKLFYPALERQPSGFVSLATALDEYLAPPQIVVLRGAPGALAQWQRALAAHYRPDTLILALPASLTGLPPVLDKSAPDGGVNAWVCRGVTCSPAINELAGLERMLSAGRERV